jgi:hypothetical protein
VRFTRRQLREALPFGDTQLKVHLARLADYELVIAHRLDSGTFAYTLAWAPRDGEDAADAVTTPGRSGLEDSRSGPGRPPVGGWSAPGRPVSPALNGQASGHVRAASNGDHAGSTDPGRGNHRVIAASGGAR